MGNTKSVTATVAGSSTYGGLTSYQYSTKDEVTQESSARNGGYTYAFGYDGAGNPTTFKGVTHGFNSSNQDTANTYDLEGNPTTYKGTGMTWDAEDRLTGIGSTWTAGYRGDSLRAWKNNAGTKTYFLYDGGTPVVELSSTGAVTAFNVIGAAGLASRRATTTHCYTFDLQGNVAQRLTTTGSVEAAFSFDAYGVGHVTGSTDPFGFGAQAGYYTDLETGLQAMSFRYYDAGAGRWLNRDPAGYGGGINLYGYCGNGSVGRLDPSGLDFLEWADQHILFGTASAFGRAAGCHDAGRASTGQVIGAGAKAAAVIGLYAAGGGLLGAGARVAVPALIARFGASGAAAAAAAGGAGGTQQLYRVITEGEANAIEQAGGLVPSTFWPRAANMTRVFDSSLFDEMLSSPTFEDRTHLVQLTVREGWANHISNGGAVMLPDGSGGYIVDVTAINAFTQPGSLQVGQIVR